MLNYKKTQKPKHKSQETVMTIGIDISGRAALFAALTLGAIISAPLPAFAQDANGQMPQSYYASQNYPYTTYPASTYPTSAYPHPAYKTAPYGTAATAPAAQQNSRDDSPRFSGVEENDYFASHDDRHYTQGLELSYLTTPVQPDDAFDQPFGFMHDLFGVYGGDARKRKYEWVAGQSIFTPSNTETQMNLPYARPYAAWLYGGANLLQDTDHGSYHTLENTELQLGVVGPPAMGGITQNTFHQFIGDTASLGWKNQLHAEPGAILSYEKKWRFQQPIYDNFAIDFIPEAGADVGNVLTYGDVGGIVRIGQNLGADYGPNRIKPSLSGTAWFDPDQLHGRLGWYGFFGTQGRVVGQNIFLDGNTYQPSDSVNKKYLVADFIGGASLIWSQAIRTDFTVTQRTHEYYGQQGHPDRFGGINLVVGF
jgi:lipid A 3-O-deacylase